MAEAVKRRPDQYSAPNATYGNVAYDLGYTGAARHPQRGGSEVLRPQPRVRQRAHSLTRPVVRVREAGQVSPFAVIGFLAVGIFATLLLLSYVRLTVTADNVASLKTELAALEDEHTKLLAQYELAYDLNSIEAQVTSNGSMVKPEAGQIFTLDLSEPDSVVRYSDATQAETAAAGVQEELSALWRRLVEYFR